MSMIDLYALCACPEWGNWYSPWPLASTPEAALACRAGQRYHDFYDHA